MSPVTPGNVHRHPQWRVTPLGRLIRPMRMRPARPLGLPLDVLKAAHSPGPSRGKQGKERKRRAPPPTRARRQTIDPLRWGSTHLAGVFLDGGDASPVPSSSLPLVAGGGRGAAGGGANGESTEVEADEEVEEILDTSQSPAGDNDDSDVIPRAASPRSSSPVPVISASADLAAEKARTLQLLNSMFGQGNEDWGGVESIDSDMEQVAAESRTNVVPRASQSSHGATTDFEVVPAAQRRADNKSSFVNQQAQNSTATSQNADPDPDPVQRPSTTNLKDLFAPREEQGEPFWSLAW